VNTITQHFDQAALSYDDAASVQAQVAEHLVTLVANATSQSPEQILDLGCGTGFAAEVARREWPQASITAFDVSPAMLREAQRKMPDLKIVSGNAAEAHFPPAFDLIFSSMMLHWLPNPRAALMRWQGWLKPNGCLYAALPVEGSFSEWRAVCHMESVEDGLWPLPPATFADDLAAYRDMQTIVISYLSAREFLRHLKTMGAAMPRKGHKPFNPAAMRRMLAYASQPFSVTYRVLYLKLFARYSDKNP
jgi:malonyl-CoA O-methyltransferase